MASTTVSTDLFVATATPHTVLSTDYWYADRIAEKTVTLKTDWFSLTIVPRDTSIHTAYFVGADSAGTVQYINIGDTDDGTLIPYELETQDIETKQFFHKKKIVGRVVAFSDNAHDGRLQIQADQGDFGSIRVKLDKRVSVGQTNNPEGNKFTVKWSGVRVDAAPILEGIYFEDIKDEGVIDN
jgi:hypothetical protein